MTRLYEKIRKESKIELGFGTEVMKTRKICSECGTVCKASQHYCNDCQSALPDETLFESYAKRHRRCTDCGTVAAKGMNYCPSCGKSLPLYTSDSIIQTI